MATATASPAPTATAIYAVAPGGSYDDWSIPDGWTAGADLATDGSSSGDAWIEPPLTIDSTSDYGIDFTFTVASADQCPRSFGVAIRGSDDGYYAAGFLWNCDPVIAIWANQQMLVQQPVALTDGPHQMRLQASGSQIAVLLDGQTVLIVDDEKYPGGGEIGFWSDGVPVHISDVNVTAAQPVVAEGTPHA